jgi:hypothetical protein
VNAQRTIHQAEAVAWLKERETLAGASVVTSLPDVSELPQLGFAGWCRWFEDAAAVVMGSVPAEGVAIFFQSDIRHAGLWVDKGAMVARSAERAGGYLLFHRIVCRHPAGTLSSGRATYSHLLGFASAARPPSGHPRADVIPDAGLMPGKKAMGVNACLAACQFVLQDTPTRTIVDPFCGWGTVLAVANALGMDSVGVDLSSRMCRRARVLDLSGEVNGALGRVVPSPAVCRR